MFKEILNLMNSKEVQNLAESAKETDFGQEENIRSFIHEVTGTFGASANKEMEDKLTDMILNGQVPQNFDDLMNLINKKK